MISLPRIFRGISASLAATLLLSSCTLAPKYKRPTPKVDTQYPNMDREDKNAKFIDKAPAHLGWNTFFTDPRLKKLIELAVTHNQDVAAQVAAVYQARGHYMVQNSSLFPSISAGTGAEFQDPSDMGYSFTPGETKEFNTGLLKFYSTSIGFSSYEIDLWGRIRNLTTAQKEATLANAANLRNLWITLVSQIASTYIQWLADKEKLELARQILHLEHHLFDESNLSFDVGNIDRAVMAEAIASLEEAEGTFDEVQRNVEEDEHLLTLLVGTTLPKDLPPPRPLGKQTLLDDLPPGLPSDLLTQRPDIMQAEHNLIAAHAVIGAARAAFLPRLSLTAGEGVDASKSFHNMWSKMAETWTLSPQLTVPIFTFGQNLGNLRIANAKQRQMLAQYQKAIQTAFREVSDALTARRTYKRQEDRAIQYVEHVDDIVRVAQERYKVGSISAPDLIALQELYRNAETNQITVSAARYQNMVTLYRVLGGGWRKEDLIPQPKKGKRSVTRADEGHTGVKGMDDSVKRSEKARKKESPLEKANNISLSPFKSAGTP